MENFLSLSKEKQIIILDAALLSFGTNGYKKSSVRDIATAAGISKAMIFHYFGTKKDLYLHLVNFSSSTLMSAMDEKLNYGVTDFFDRMKLAMDIKISVMKKHPAILLFLNSMYLEKDDEVKADIQAALKKGEGFRSKVAHDDIDATKFKEGIDPNLVMKMITWLAEGYVSKLPSQAGLNIEDLFKEFDECINLLRNHFYKGEYL